MHLDETFGDGVAGGFGEERLALTDRPLPARILLEDDVVALANAGQSEQRPEADVHVAVAFLRRFGAEEDERVAS